MPIRYSAAAVLVLVSLSACSAQGPGGVPYETRSEPKAATGVTSSGDGGTISGGSASGEKKEKEQRGNTPPGTSRDGQGPAAGAIVDPTGAVTRGK